MANSEFAARLPAMNQTTKLYETSFPKSISSFVIGSCSHQLADLSDMATLWNSVYASNPSVIILGGDNIYADYYLNYKLVQTRDNLARAFVHGLEKIPLYNSEKLIPLLSIWDDHDYGMGDGNKTFHLKQDALTIFQMVYSPWAKPTKDALYQNYSEINPKYSLVILDARSQRDPNGGKDHLGQAQLDWLKNELSLIKKKRVLLIKGDQFFGAYHRFESYEKDHAEEFKQFLQMVGAVRPTPIFISGDRHLTEHQIVQIDKNEIHEFTSSPLHAKVFPKSAEAKLKDNPARLWVEDSQYNFMKFNLLDKLHVETFNSKGQKLYDFQE
jgi:alkaline phosphatase D